jgi:hypothetical protein
MDDDDLRRSTYRAKKNLRHKILMMRADRMLTLTVRNGFKTQADAMKAWDSFRRRCMKSWPKFSAVMVTELHTGAGPNFGTFHIHVALNAFYSVNMLRHFWHKSLGAPGLMRGVEAPGNVDIRTGPKGGVFRREALARYLSKYLSKGMEHQQINSKRYSSCGAIPDPVVVKYYLPICDDIEHRLAQLLLQESGARAKSFYEVPGTIERTICMSTY